MRMLLPLVVVLGCRGHGTKLIDTAEVDVVLPTTTGSGTTGSGHTRVDSGSSDTSPTEPVETSDTSNPISTSTPDTPPIRLELAAASGTLASRVHVGFPAFGDQVLHMPHHPRMQLLVSDPTADPEGAIRFFGPPFDREQGPPDETLSIRQGERSFGVFHYRTHIPSDHPNEILIAEGTDDLLVDLDEVEVGEVVERESLDVPLFDGARALGDLNADGSNDVVRSNGEDWPGDGVAAHLAPHPLGRLIGSDDSDYLLLKDGHQTSAVALIDLGSDSISDLLIASQNGYRPRDPTTPTSWAWGPPSWAGLVFLHSGVAGDRHLEEDADLVLHRESERVASLGSVASLGDLDGDGYEDLRTGTAVLFGPPPSGVHDVADVAGAYLEGDLGARLHAAGDLLFVTQPTDYSSYPYVTDHRIGVFQAPAGVLLWEDADLYIVPGDQPEDGFAADVEAWQDPDGTTWLAVSHTEADTYGKVYLFQNLQDLL